MYILRKNIKAIGKSNGKSTPKNENISKNNYSTILAEITLLLYAIEQFQPTLYYKFSQ